MEAARRAEELGLRPTTDESSDLRGRDFALSTVVSRALAAIACVLACQLITAPSWLPEFISAPLSAWERTRVRHQLVLASACAFAMYSASDALTQCIPARRQQRLRLDMVRCVRSGLTSGLLSGFLAVFYFAWLDRVLAVPARWSEAAASGNSWLLSLGSAASKAAVDVGCYEPVYDVLYITLQALMRGESLHSAREEVVRKVPTIWRMAPRYWLLTDMVNFLFVSLRLRPLYNAFFSIPWSCYISSIVNA